MAVNDPRDWGTETAGNTMSDNVSCGGGFYWAAPYIPPPQPAPFIINSPQIIERIIERVIERPEEVKAMRGLYQVWVVDPESDVIMLNGKPVVAKSEQSARIKAVRLAGPDIDPDEVDIIVVRLGDVRAKREVQEVKVITD